MHIECNDALITKIAPNRGRFLCTIAEVYLITTRYVVLFGKIYYHE